MVAGALAKGTAFSRSFKLCRLVIPWRLPEAWHHDNAKEAVENQEMLGLLVATGPRGVILMKTKSNVKNHGMSETLWRILKTNPCTDLGQSFKSGNEIITPPKSLPIPALKHGAYSRNRKAKVTREIPANLKISMTPVEWLGTATEHELKILNRGPIFDQPAAGLLSKDLLPTSAKATSEQSKRGLWTGYH